MGEQGEGETGVRGRAWVAVMGDLRESAGRDEDCAAVEMLRESLGLTERADDASIFAVTCVLFAV